MLMNANESALLIIDVQEKLMPAIHDGATVLAQNIRLATIASLLGLPVIATEQTPEKLGPNHPDTAQSLNNLADLPAAPQRSGHPLAAAYISCWASRRRSPASSCGRNTGRSPRPSSSTRCAPAASATRRGRTRSTS